MKKQNKNANSINTILDKYNEFLDQYKLCQPEEVQNKIDVLQKETQDYLKERKKTSIQVISIMFIATMLALGAIFVQDYKIQNYRNDIIEKQGIIIRLQSTDSLFNQIMETKLNDGETHRTYFYLSRDGEVVSYNELSTENNTLVFEKDSLLRKYNEIKFQMNLLEDILDFIGKKYEIVVTKIDERKTLIEAHKIDSALMLLPYYRNKLEYDSIDRVWIITHPQN
ncbi:MAG: hypothetical protein LBU91_04730 [Bacteroidales bacterium]|jgi:hypothetical protein|nr:hypothetical protein [Bacteroidales bacterium]